VVLVGRGSGVRAAHWEVRDPWRALAQAFSCRAHGEIGVQDAALLAELVGEGADAGRGTADHDHLGAAFVREMDVGGGQDAGVVVVLDFDQAIRELPRLMVVNQCNGADDLVLFVGPFLLDEAFADQIADILRAVGVPAGLHQTFEPLGQRFFQRHAQTRQCGQGSISSWLSRATTPAV